MADAPPPGPPPPKVPAGWKAVYNAQYSEYFYVNTYTKKSQWDKPTEPAKDPNADAPPSGAPPGYSGGSDSHFGGDEKKNPNNPYNQNDTSGDAEMARRLQEEEQARTSGKAGATRGAADSFYNDSSAGGYPGSGPQQHQGAPPPGYDQSQYQQQPGASGQRGLLGKIMGKVGGSNKPQQGYGGGPPPQQGYGGYSPGPGYQQGPYGGPPPQGYYGGPPQGYPPQGGYYGGGQPQYVQQQPPKKSGIGAGGAAALGVGGGLIGGMLLADAIEDHDDHEYEQGYDQGYDDGGDYGGGDF